jgi:uncharacterized repeat protein (TIGR03803 family)
VQAMKNLIRWSSLLTAFVVAALTIAGAQESILYNFHYVTTGSVLNGGVIFDQAGNLYGTTEEGGTNKMGTVYELTPRGDHQGWAETVLYNFSGSPDGTSPIGSLVFDTHGNLYGVTAYGGAHSLGTVFELSPAAGGGWTETVLYSFAGGTDGSYPGSGLILDKAGNLYGVTTYGACTGFGLGCGMVYELSPQAGGGWEENILYSFTANSLEGYHPNGNLVFDASGNLYGTASGGGPNYQGDVYELSPQAGGGWAITVLYGFNYTGSNFTDGADPLAGVTFDSKGNLYGTTYEGGTNNLGTVYKLTPAGGGVWTESVLHSFGPALDDGTLPWGPVIIDSRGILYGTTSQGGGLGGVGTVYGLALVNHVWTEKILYSFVQDSKNGATPVGSLIFDASENLYGATNSGGFFGGGTVFRTSR